MAGTITRQIQRSMAKHLLDDLEDSANAKYYIGVGTSETWNDSDVAPTAIATEREERNFRERVQSIKSVADYSLVVERYNWTSGTVYSAWNDSLVGDGSSPYYVITDENSVYMVIKQAKNDLGVATASTVKPTGAAQTYLFTSDGYVWKFLYAIPTATANKFLSSAWMPIKYVDSASAGGGDIATDIEQIGIQNTAIPGQINDLILTAGGTGYSDIPTVTISGDGDSNGAFTYPRGKASISGGSVVKVEIIDSDSVFYAGRNFKSASVAFSGGGGSGAAARVSLSPRLGFGEDPAFDLRNKAIMFDIQPSGDEAESWVIGNDFRQVGLYKNLLLTSTDADSDLSPKYTGANLNLLKALKLQGLGTATNSFTVGSTISGGTSGAKGIIDKKDSDLLYFHSNETLGFKQFQVNEAITDLGSGSGTVVNDSANMILEPIADPMTGELLYIENRTAVVRASGQTEDIKIVIQM
jgi:hypothetical protein